MIFPFYTIKFINSSTIEERNLDLKQNKISLWWERWFLSSNAKDIGTLYLIFALFLSLLGTAFSVLIRLELSVPGVQYIIDNQLYNNIITVHAILMIFFMVMPLLPEYIHNSPPKPHAFTTTPLLAVDTMLLTAVSSAAVCASMSPLTISICVFLVAMGVQLGIDIVDELTYTQLVGAIETVLDSLRKGHPLHELLGWTISPELLEQLMQTNTSLAQCKACIYRVMELSFNSDVSSRVYTMQEIAELGDAYFSDREAIIYYSQDHGIKLGHLKAIGRCMNELPSVDVSAMMNTLNTFRK